MIKMKLTCKQCGKEFELSESEINFYKSKNLHIPKRCEQCRQANKKNKSASAKPYENPRMQSSSYTPSGNSGWNNGRNNKLLCAILIIAIVLLTGGILLSRADLFSRYYESTKPIYGADAYTSGDIHNQPESTTETFNNQAEADTASSKSETETNTVNNESDTETGEADTAQSTETTGNVSEPSSNAAQDKPEAELDEAKDKPAAEPEASSETTQETSENNAQPAQSSSVSTPQYKFRNSELLNDHFEKHGKEMGFATAEDYQAAASAVVTSANALHKLEAEDGDDVYYIESTNDFVIVSTDGYIRTYFRPNSGIEYYNRQ